MMENDVKNQSVSIDFGSDVIKMTQNFGNWYPGKDDPIHTVCADEIEDTLVADFDGTLGLGVDLRGAYNMSETLNALPVFNEPLEQPDTFTTILMASTSPATKLNEESLTYLNQGKPYELRLSRQGCYINNYALMKSTVRVLFHERRLQVAEREQLNTWRMTRPGERILDVDEPLSYGICRVIANEETLNSVDCYYLPCNTVGLYIKVHCISTEFTARKHGGERGIPFRIQVFPNVKFKDLTHLDVETYGMPVSPLNSPTSLSQSEFNIDNMLLSCIDLLHCSVCQIKVFTTKGADRKNKTDKEKIAKRSDIERLKYHPSRVQTILAQIELNSTIMPSGDFLLSTPRPSPSHHVILSGTDTRTARSQDANALSDDSSKSYDTNRFSKCTSQSSPASLSNEIIATEELSIESIITNKSTPHHVREWLTFHRFNKYMNILHDFTGYDLLCLSRDDLIQICGIADGIRLNNALQSKITRPKLTLYLCQDDLPLLRRQNCRERPTSITSISSLLSNSSLLSCIEPDSALIRNTVTTVESPTPPIVTTISIKSEPTNHYRQYENTTGRTCAGISSPSTLHHRTHSNTPYSTNHRTGIIGSPVSKTSTQTNSTRKAVKSRIAGQSHQVAKVNTSKSVSKVNRMVNIIPAINNVPSRIGQSTNTSIPSITTPSNAIPSINTPSNAIPSITTPSNAIPSISTPSNAIPSITTPSNAINSNINTESISCQTNLKFDPSKDFMTSNQNYSVLPLSHSASVSPVYTPYQDIMLSKNKSVDILQEPQRTTKIVDPHTNHDYSCTDTSRGIQTCDIFSTLTSLSTTSNNRRRHPSDQMLSLANQVSCTTLDSENSPPNNENSILRSLIASNPVVTTSYSPEERRPSNQLSSVKRQLLDDEEPDCDNNDLQKMRAGIKKQKTFSEEILYKAVYLEQLTVDDFKEKIAPLCLILAKHITDCTVQTSSGVNVIMTDDVIHNLPNENRYHMKKQKNIGSSYHW